MATFHFHLNYIINLHLTIVYLSNCFNQNFLFFTLAVWRKIPLDKPTWVTRPFLFLLSSLVQMKMWSDRLKMTKRKTQNFIIWNYRVLKKTFYAPKMSKSVLKSHLQNFNMPNKFLLHNSHTLKFFGHKISSFSFCRFDPTTLVTLLLSLYSTTVY